MFPKSAIIIAMVAVVAIATKQKSPHLAMRAFS
jgi:hypothetical protein